MMPPRFLSKPIAKLLCAAALISPLATARPAAAVTLSVGMGAVTSSGAPDGQFAGSGYRVAAVPGCSTLAEVVDADVRGSKIVVAGACYYPGFSGSYVMRFNLNGQADGTFGAGGSSVAYMPGLVATSVVIDSANRVVIAGEKNGHMAVARFTSTGVPELGFGSANGSAGIAEANFPTLTAEGATSVTVDSNNRILVAGDGTHANYGKIFGVARLTTAGTLDTTFSGDGMNAVNIADGTSEDLVGVAWASDGKVVLAGTATLSSGTRQFAVARLDSAGGHDLTFSTDGQVVFDIPGASADYCHAVAVDSQRRVVLGGLAWYPDAQFVVARLTSGGALDSNGFGSGGITHTNFSSSTAEGIFDVKVISGDKVLVSGDANLSGKHQLAGARYNANGTPDTAFHVDGKILVDIPGWGAQGYAVGYDSGTAKTFVVGPIF